MAMMLLSMLLLLLLLCCRCAARLKMLCGSALRAYAKHGVFTPTATTTANANASNFVGEGPVTVQRGLLINYEALPGVVPRALLPMFGVKPSPIWLAKMAQVTTFYSKGRKAKAGVFAGDSEQKDKGSNEAIQTYAKLLLSDSFSQLETALEEGLTRLGVALPANQTTVAVGATATVIRDWKSMKPVPTTAVNPLLVRGMGITGLTNASLLIDGTTDINNTPSDTTAATKPWPRYLDDGSRYNHSVFEFDTHFKPWIPFSNNHNSRTFEVCTDSA